MGNAQIPASEQWPRAVFRNGRNPDLDIAPMASFDRWNISFILFSLHAFLPLRRVHSSLNFAKS